MDIHQILEDLLVQPSLSGNIILLIIPGGGNNDRKSKEIESISGGGLSPSVPTNMIAQGTSTP